MPSYDSKQISTCTFCPRLCRHVCPAAMGESSETLTPTHKMGLVQLWQLGAIPLDQELAEVFYGCNDCGACTANCKHKARPAETLYNARQDAVALNHIPPKVRDIMQKHEEHGNPYGPLQYPKEMKTSSEAQANVAYLPGCASLHHRPDTIPTLFNALQEIQPESISLCDAKYCCGATLHATGAQTEHREQAKQFLHQHKDVTSLVVGDPHCARHIQVRYPQIGLDLPFHVNHLLHALDELPLEKRKPDPSPVFYHDSSPLGRHSGIYDLPRNLLYQLHSNILEFTRNRFLALDSAAGGILRWTSLQGALHNANWLMDEIRHHAQHHNMTTLPALVTVGETERSLLAQANPDIIVKDLQVMLAEAIAS